MWCLQFGLESKYPERLEDGTQVLGLEVWGECGTLRWKRRSVIPDVPEVVTRRTIFSLCRKLIRHLPVCGWLRVATGMIKRKANAVTQGWDDTTEDAPLQQMVWETIARVMQSYPSQGLWCATGQDINVWIDASSLATGVLLECDDVVFEDAYWLQPANDAQHINLPELNAALKGIDLALQWKCKVIHLKTDMVSVYGHAHRKDQSTHEGHQRNVAPPTIGNDKVAG